MSVVRTHPMSFRLGAGSIGFAVVVLLAESPLARQAPCEATVRPVAGTLGYRSRGTRCEGMFVRDTAAAVRIKAIVAGAPPDARQPRLAISPLGTPPAGMYFLRVTSIDPAENYQLDARVHWPGSFSWPAADVLGPASVSAARLAPVSWSGADSDRLYIAVRFDTETVAPAPVTVLFESTVPFEVASATLVPPPGLGGSGAPLPLDAAAAPLPTIQKFTIPAGASSGRTTLWLRWRFRGASNPDSTHLQVWLP